jgi:hypothetical protein
MQEGRYTLDQLEPDESGEDKDVEIGNKIRRHGPP